MVQTQHRRAGLGMPTAKPRTRSASLVVNPSQLLQFLLLHHLAFCFYPVAGNIPCPKAAQGGFALPEEPALSPSRPPSLPTAAPNLAHGQGAGHSKTSPSLLPASLGSPGSAHIHITSLLLTPCPQHQPRTLAPSSALPLAVLPSTSTTKGQLHPRVPRGAARRDAAGRG